MKIIFKIIIVKFLLLFHLVFSSVSFADSHNIYEVLEIIKNDLKTLEIAVYSWTIEVQTSTTNNSNTDLDSNSEDVLTRHLLKLSEIENQFQQLTNKFEEINFKLDKLSNRLSKVQADNQLRFQDLEIALSGELDLKKVSKKSKEEKILPLGLSDGAITKKNINKDQVIMLSDVELDLPKQVIDARKYQYNLI